MVGKKNKNYETTVVYEVYCILIKKKKLFLSNLLFQIFCMKNLNKTVRKMNGTICVSHRYPNTVVFIITIVLYRKYNFLLHKKIKMQ